MEMLSVKNRENIESLRHELDEAIMSVEQKVISWRRDIHKHPELGFQEVRTAGLVADHLHSVQLDEVRTGVGQTGVVGVLRGGRSGRVVALRADMDALPVKEKTNSGREEKTLSLEIFSLAREVEINFKREKKAANSSSTRSPSTRHLKRMPRAGMAKVVNPRVNPFFSR